MASNLNLAKYKSAGIYFEEIDNTVTSLPQSDSLRLIVGFANKGIFNRPCYLSETSDRVKYFGEINTKLEHKGCFFNRMIKTLLGTAPVLALNLLKVDESVSGPDQVNYAALSLDAGTPNPEVENPGNSYGEYDYLGSSLDNLVYNTDEGDVVPYIGKMPYAALFDRSRFWVPAPEHLLAQAAIGLSTGDSASFENTNFFNIGNISTDEISVLMYKPESITGYDITASEWYGGTDNIPFGWIRPSDYMSDYFLTVVVVKGNWTNYANLSTDNIWGTYFDSKGIKKNKINRFLIADGIELLGSFTGSIIPNFEDKQGNAQNIIDKINAVAEKTGLMVSFNEDAAELLSFDYNGTSDEGEEVGSGCWFMDIDGDRQQTISQGEKDANTFLIDMVGHNLQTGFKDANNPTETTAAAIKSINKAKLAGISDRVTAYLPGYDSLVKSDALSETMGNFKVGSLTYEYTLKYTASNYKVELMINCDTKQRGYSTAKMVDKFNVSFEIVRKNQLDTAKSTTPVSVKVNNIDATSKEFVATALNDGATVKMYGGDVITLNIANAATKDASNAVVIPANEIDVVFESPLDVSLSSEYTLSDNTPAPYGNYIVALLDKNGAVQDADIYTLRRKAVVSSRSTTYKDVFEEVVTNVELKKVGNKYIFTYGTGTRAVKYTITDFSSASSAKIVAEYNPANSSARLYGPNFLSYGFVTTDVTDIISRVSSVHYFNDAAAGEDVYPTEKDTYNMFIVTDDEMAKKISIGDLVNNKAFRNEYGVAQHFKTIPGLTRITNKVFVNVNANGEFVYNGISYTYAFPEEMIVSHEFGTQGFYLFTAIDPVDITESDKIEREYTYGKVNNTKVAIYPVVKDATQSWDDVKEYDGSTSDKFITPDKWEDEFGTDITETVSDVEGSPKAKVVMVDGYYKVILVLTGNIVTKQVPLTDDAVSSTLRFIPLKGLKISSRHKPGYDENGNIDIEGGIKKIYSVLDDEGIRKGLCSKEMVDYRYIIDSMGFGLDSELGGKVYLSKLAMERGKTTALLNLPSKRQFATSENPYFCDTYVNGVQIKPPFKAKYIASGGNEELYSSKRFSLPTEDNGAKFAAAFWPFLEYTESNGKKVLVPPAADVANCLTGKFMGGDPYAICANTTGILGGQVTGVEYNADQTDRDYLEPMGVNCIIKDGNEVMIYGNQTCFQKVKSDFNKLHIRENLNTLEIECEKIIKKFNFKYNTAIVRAKVVTDLTPVIQTMQNSGALESAKLVCDETNNTEDIIRESFGVVDVHCKMNHGMEKIIQRIYLNKSASDVD